MTETNTKHKFVVPYYTKEDIEFFNKVIDYIQTLNKNGEPRKSGELPMAKSGFIRYLLKKTFPEL